ncbi:MAG TPA: putative toxin-antitoxin system toxin component, PIN family [Nitrospirae bacterium]|nr:putative toxin-antitoxin system toxin component, PIN family [Nitrospirota bacterium]HDO25027.1 putative toxin-antitoxin system toxin component, PIN family [Nitrospirota bacterium]
MKVIADTNVLVSAILKDKAPEEVILFIAERPDIEWIVSPQILTEYWEVLSRKKFGLPEDIKRAWFSVIDSLTSIVDADIPAKFNRDEKDAIFLSCAIVSGADYLVTGDKDFSEAERLVNTTIISVSQFKRLVIDALS